MSLRKACRELVLELILPRVTTSEDDSVGRVQLIGDENTIKFLNSFLRMGDLHAQGVTSMELIQRSREPLPALDALYLLEPTLANIEAVVRDYQVESLPQHRNVHLVFVQSLSGDLMSKLADSKVLAPRVRSCFEVPLTFSLVQDRGFHFDMLDALPGLFPVAEAGLLKQTSHKMADLCRCLQVTLPCIRYQQNATCRSLAEQVQTELSVFAPPSGDNALPCQVLIVDRSVDLAAVLVHEYSYEAAAYDLLDGDVLDIDRNLVSLKGNQPRELLLSETDSLWEQTKHLHLEQVQKIIDSKVDEVRGQNVSQDAAQMTTGVLLDMLRRSPEQRDTMDRLFLHLSLMESIFGKLRDQHLMTGVGLLEQDIACGLDKSGKDVKATNLQALLSRTFAELENTLPGESKLRLLMLYFTRMANVSEVVRQKLIEMARLRAEDQDVLMAMLRTKLMEVPDSQRHKLGSGGCVHRVTKSEAARFKRNAQSDGRFELSRFEPRVKELVEQLSQGKLSEEDFPCLGSDGGESNTLRSGGFRGCAASAGAAGGGPGGDSWSFSAWPTAGGNAKPVDASVSQRIIIFVLGGMTFSELRATRETVENLPRGTEVLLGGSALLTPKRFISALRSRKEYQTSDPDDLT